jgi:hypothetical protein
LRVETARRYFDLAMAQGDPRYVGYASGALAPLQSAPPNDPAYWTARGLIEQYNHDFDAALASLARASRLAPAVPEPYAWRAAVFMVQARYAQALDECAQLARVADPLWATGCRTYARAAGGALQPSYDALLKALAEHPDAEPALRQWVLTRLAEMALRLQLDSEAERFLQQAWTLGLTDQFLLGALSDFLLEHKRPAEVLRLLDGWERSDILLLRLALAAKDARDPRAGDWARQLRERFAAAAQRGDRLHEYEAARFELDIENKPDRALRLAASNYSIQREPRDAYMLMRAALAARQPAAAAPALDWWRAHRYEDPAFTALADQLSKPEAK